MEHFFLRDLGFCLGFAAILGIFQSVLRQPLVLGYILAGFLLGPNVFGLVSDHSRIELISEIGLVLLMFILGQEIDLKALVRSGRFVLIPGIFQFVLSFFCFLPFLKKLGFRNGNGSFELFYLCYALSLSSTTVVVKILSDRFDFETLASKITIGVLVLQDLWAISFLSLQPTFLNPEPLAIVWSITKGFLLVGGALLIAKTILPFVFRSVSRSPEVYLIVSMGWCFAVAQISAAMGLSKEMGALVAGISLSAFPFHVDISSKISSLRDFFVTLFFVGLGLRIPIPSNEILRLALLISGFLIFSRVVIVCTILYAMRLGIRTSMIPAINLSQLSEFAPVLFALGLTYKHVQQETLSLVILVLVFTLAVSSYSIVYAHFIVEKLVRVLKLVGLKELDHHGGWDFSDKAAQEVKPEIVFYGFFRDASSLLHEILSNSSDTELKKKILTIGYNPLAHRELKELGVHSLYGDAANTEMLRYVDLSAVKTVFSTIPDHTLRGTSNLKILRYLRAKLPTAKLILTAETFEQAQKLYEAGADFVYFPRMHGARHLYDCFLNLENLESMRAAEMEEIKDRKEILG